MKLIIIEDENYAVKRLRDLILSLEPDWEIIHVFDEVKESINWLKTNEHPDLIFMDIQLADGFSFEIFDQIKIKSQVIFTTAFDNYAVKAFRHNGLDYLLKPIQKDLLAESILRYKNTGFNQNINIEKLTELLKSPDAKHKKRFLTKSGDQLNFIDTNDIAYFISESSYSFVFSKSGNQYILDDSLDQIEKSLDPFLFFRINRKQIIALHSIASIKSYFNNRLILTLNPELKDETIVSRTKVKAFKQWLNQ